MSLYEQISESQALRKRLELVDLFLSGTVEGMLGKNLEWWRGPRLAMTSKLYPDFIKGLRDNFLIENLVTPAVDNHVDALLGNEVDWKALRGAGEAVKESQVLTDWYYSQRVQETLYDAAGTLQYATVGDKTSSLLRYFVPRRAITEGGVLRGPLPDKLKQAVRLTHPRASDSCGVLREDGEVIAGWFAYVEGQGTEKRNVLELVATDTEFERQEWTRLRPSPAVGATVLQLRTGNEWEQIIDEVVYPLGGNLTIYEMSRKPLITEDVISQQAGLNSQWTYLNKGAADFAFLERIFTNGLPPGRWVNDKGEPDPKGSVYEVGDYETGSATTNFISGVPGDDGKPANVGVHFREPSSTVTMRENIAEHRYAIMNAVNQLHRLIAGDATATGVARIQAASDFSSSLKPTETQVKLGLKWALETALRLGGYFETGREVYTDVSFDVSLKIQAVTPTPEELQLYIAQRDAGVFDDDELRRRSGIADVEVMRKAVDAQADKKFARQQELFRMRQPQPVEVATP